MNRSVRRALLVVHRWLTFLLGGVFVLVAGSGALLVYQHEIDAFLNRGRYAPTAGDVGWRAVTRSVRATFPEARLDLLWWPRWNVPIYEAYLEHPDGRFETVGIDPGSGTVVPPEHGGNQIMDTINSFHTTLLAGEAGYWLVLLSTGAAVVLAVTGLVLWWPGIRRLACGFRVRLHRSFYFLNYDAHQVAGVLVTPVLLVMAVTGFALAFPNATASIVHAAFGEERPPEVYWTEVRSDPPPPGFAEADRPDYDTLLARAHTEVPGARTFYVTFPHAPDDPIHIRLQTGIDPKPFGIVSRLAFDQYTGELLQVVDPRRKRTRAAAAQAWVDPLHMGHFAGHGGRVLYIVVCLVTIVLFAGGLYIWWAKRQRAAGRRPTGTASRHQARRRPGRPVAPVPVTSSATDDPRSS